MVSTVPTLSALDEITQRVQAEPDSPSRAAALAALHRQRAALVVPETATGEIGEILRELQSGAISTAVAAERLAAMTWPSAGRHATLADTESDPDVAGPFAAVEAAFIDGRITSEQYSAIIAAIGVARPVG